MCRLFLWVLLLCQLGFAAPPRKKFWWASVAALGVATAMDVHSSWNRLEMNSMLRSPNGRFGPRGAVIKVSFVGVNTGLQWLLLRRLPRMDRSLAGANTGLAAWTAGIAIRNTR